VEQFQTGQFGEVKKACGTVLVMYAACAAVLAAIIYHRVPDFGSAALVAIIAAIPAWFGITYLWEVARRFAAARMIRRAERGETPRDGEKIAAIGRIMPNGPTLASPFSKSECVIYDYKIATGRTSEDSNLYVGFAQSPSTIQTPYGGVRLLAYADLKVVDSTIPREQALPNAREYIQSTEFRAASIRGSLKELLDAYKDDDGSIRYDNRLHDANIDSALFVEKVVRPCDEVCAIGLYSQQRGGIVPNLKSPLINQTTLEPGGAEAPLKRARSGAIGYGIGACIFLSIVAVGFFAFIALNPLESAENEDPAMNATWPEIRLEWFVDRWVRTPMQQAGMIRRGLLVTNLSVGTAHGRVKAGGRDITVSRASADRVEGRTTVRIDDDAVVLTINSQNQPVRMRIFGREIAPQSIVAEIAQDENRISGRVSVRGEPACRLAFRAQLGS